MLQIWPFSFIILKSKWNRKIEYMIFKTICFLFPDATLTTTCLPLAHWSLIQTTPPDARCLTVKRPHLDQTSLSPSRDSLNPSQDMESPRHYLLPSLPLSTHSCQLSSLLLLLSLALLNQMVRLSCILLPTKNV